MSAKRGESGLSGILLVDKPAGITSHDVVSQVRRATGERRVGHAGTLDPLATGLLVILVGPATRLAPYLTAAEKTYQATIAFGSQTDTDDADGEVVRTADVGPETFDAAAAQTLLDGFLGQSMQTPPAYSAIKVEGRTAHRAARAGTALELKPRAIGVFEATITDVDAGSATWDATFRVSKGTYIRSLARDIGERAGTAAHLAALRRTASGELSVGDAVPLAQIEAAADPCEVAAVFTDPVAALGLPTLEVAEEGFVRVSAGQPLDPAAHCTGQCPASGPVAIAREGALLAVYELSGGSLRAQTVLPGGVRGGEL